MRPVLVVVAMVLAGSWNLMEDAARLVRGAIRKGKRWW